MKAAVTCIFQGAEISVSEALKLRSESTESPYFTCVGCGEPVRAHKLAENHSKAHFEHFERNLSCPYSSGKSDDERFDVNDQRAIEGYERDKKILSISRNLDLAKQCKVRDKFTCQACGFKLKLNGKYVIECHHKNPIGMGGVRETSLDDLVSLCPTCHRIAHTREKPLDVNEIISARSLK